MNFENALKYSYFYTNHNNKLNKTDKILSFITGMTAVVLALHDTFHLYTSQSLQLKQELTALERGYLNNDFS